ncbi:hypothetical protein DL89DRAFT_263626 [Linderina pennispora]|uniref:SAM domain-containing protein n=1 Tax=Linderina pennispora TaxID=61395 RepID=A0A1Y1WJB5_9FUNG|nr:uncharacterized protein DL89DRAFT_263626 [Linderina pennispora]ORX73583.1 hypothetical protein DL89DRAFT_263626 [Linderina pennispora]
MVSSPVKSPSPPSTTAPLPGNPQQWTVDDVCRWAQTLPLIADISAVFKEHAVDGHVLVNYVTNTVLADELGVSAFGTRVHILEAIETLRWNSGLCAKQGKADSRSVSHTPETEGSAKEHSDGESPKPASKRSASRIADAEKKRQKRAELKKNPVLYAEYLQKERERNARRRARLRAERGRSDGSQDAGRPAYVPYAAQEHKRAASTSSSLSLSPSLPSHSPSLAAAYIQPLQPPVHNLRQGPEPEAEPGHQQTAQV